MTSRKRIRSVNPTVTGGGGGGGPTPGGTIAWTPADGDNQDHQHEVLQGIALDELALDGTLQARGAITMPALAIAGGTAARGAITLPELGMNALTRARGALSGVYTIQGMRPKQDMYLDENTPGSNFGATVNLLAKTNAAVGNNRQHTYLGFDLTGVSGTVSNASITLRISTSAALGETATYTVFSHPTQPFTEGTATWTNTEPPPGTSRGTLTQAVTTTPTDYTLNFSGTQMTNMPGNWIYLRCIGTGALGTSTITTVSKESGTTTNQPRITLTVTI